MIAAMKIGFLLAVAMLAFLMVIDARQLLDRGYDDCNRGMLPCSSKRADRTHHHHRAARQFWLRGNNGRPRPPIGD